MGESSLSRRVYDEILGRILSGRMRPGDVFNRRQIAAEMGVSVAPVLEAMLELQSEGLVQTLPRRGTRVAHPSPADLWCQLVIREAVECQAARLYCGDPVVRHVDELGRMAEALDRTHVRAADHARADIRFHHYLVALAECPELTRTFERVMKRGLLHAATMFEPDPVGRAPTHADLVVALQADDPDAAERVIRAHVRSGKGMLYAIGAGGDPVAGAPPTPTWLGDHAGAGVRS